MQHVINATLKDKPFLDTVTELSTPKRQNLNLISIIIGSVLIVLIIGIGVGWMVKKVCGHPDVIEENYDNPSEPNSIPKINVM